MTPTQLQPDLRECRSCFRDLNLGCFYMDYSNHDKFSSICKDCHKHRRRVTYYNRLEKNGRPNPEARARALPYIFPLNDQNRSVLSSLPVTSSEAYRVHRAVPAEFIKSGKPLQILVDLGSSSPRMTFEDGGEHLGTYEFSGQSKDQFIETAVRILHDLRIRLG